MEEKSEAEQDERDTGPTPRAHKSRVAWLLGLAEESKTPATKLRMLREAQASIEVWRDQVLLEVALSTEKRQPQ